MFIGAHPTLTRSFGGGLKPQDVFATSLYTGNGGTQTITNGQDLAGKGGMAWLKTRNAIGSHFLRDTARGPLPLLFTNTAGAENSTDPYPVGNGLQFNNNGFSLGPGGSQNSVGTNYAAWSFVEAPRFYKIVTYTGDGTSARQISHGLGIAPGMPFVKRRDAADDWRVRHRSASGTLYLNRTNAQEVSQDSISAVSATNLTVTDFANISGASYVAYLFAHDPDPVSGIIQCGSFTTSGSGTASATLGWLPQFVILKCSSAAEGWIMLDTSRGWGAGTDQYLMAQSSNAETSSDFGAPTATGFSAAGLIASANYVFLAIRAPIA